MKAVHAIVLFVALTRPATCELVRKNFFVHRLLSWADAQKYCRTYYDDLSTINTQWDSYKFRKDVGYYLLYEGWVGLSKNKSDSVYSHWSDGSVLGYAVWKSSKPSNLHAYHCVTISKMMLSDFNCDQTLMFFCYKWVPPMVLVEMMMTWKEALQYCRTYYTDLISVITDKDLQEAKSTSNTSQTLNVWTGLRFMDGSWFWVNQDPLVYMTSLPSCPSMPFHCGALKAGDDVWENRDCNEKMNFLCSS